MKAKDSIKVALVIVMAMITVIGCGASSKPPVTVEAQSTTAPAPTQESKPKSSALESSAQEIPVQASGFKTISKDSEIPSEGGKFPNPFVITQISSTSTTVTFGSGSERGEFIGLGDGDVYYAKVDLTTGELLSDWTTNPVFEVGTPQTKITVVGVKQGRGDFANSERVHAIGITSRLPMPEDVTAEIKPENGKAVVVANGGQPQSNGVIMYGVFTVDKDKIAKMPLDGNEIDTNYRRFCKELGTFNKSESDLEKLKGKYIGVLCYDVTDKYEARWARVPNEQGELVYGLIDGDELINGKVVVVPATSF